MPQIVVTASAPERRSRGREVMRERVTPSDLESELFVSHLVERIEWALADADSIECRERRRAANRRAGESGSGSSARRAL